MVSAAQVVPLVWDVERVQAMVPSVDASPWGPLEAAGDVLQGAYLYGVSIGESEALVAVRPVRLTHGTRMDVVGLVSLGARMRSEALDAAIVSIAKSFGADQLAMCTKSAHVERQCSRYGWEKTGVVMTRKINVEQ